MPGRLVGLISTVIVLGCVAFAIACQAFVLGSCEFLEGSTDVFDGNDNVGIGLYQFSVDDPDSDYDTGGECQRYSDWPDDNDESNVDDLPWQIRCAQVCACIAASCGITIFFVILLNF